MNRASGIPAINGAGALSTPANASPVHRYELPFGIGDFGRCARCFDYVNRIRLPRSPMGRPRPPTVKAADDRQDRTTAFTTPADLPLDPDDGAVHRPSRHR